jgi:hypothetical protein
VPAGGSKHGLALDHVDADRLLHVDVGPRLDGRDRRQGMPMVRRGDQHEVQVFLFEHFAVVAVEAGFLPRPLPGSRQLGRLAEHPLVDVAQGDDLDGRHLEQTEEVALAIPAAADQAHPFRRFAGEPRGVSVEGREGQRRRAGAKELTTIHGIAPEWE